MKSVTCLLMGSAAGLMAVSAAQAADLPVKAAPVEYVKVCDLYGAGFWYVPGTDTCMKIGAFIRATVSVNEGSGTSEIGTGNSAGAGRWDRTDTSAVGYGERAVMSFDVRTQTEYGTLRSYMNMGVEQTTSTNWPNAPITPGALTQGEPGISKDAAGNGIYANRAFIQFAGFTIGRMRSFYDITALGAYTYSTSRITADSAPGGIFGIGYTAQFGGGVSWSISVEDGGALAGGRGRFVVDMSQSAFGGNALAAGQNLDNGGGMFFDPVMGLRLDQSWGYASITGALHNDNGGYYNNAINSTNSLLANTIVQGHPGDTWGYAGSAGFLLTDFLGNAGDTFGSQIQYGKGAVGYVTRGTGTWFMRNGSNFAAGTLVDGIFADGRQIDLSTAYSIGAEYEHYWTPKLRTAVQGGYFGIHYDQDQKNLVCAGAPGFGTGFMPNAPNTPILGLPNNSLGAGVPSKTNQPTNFVNGWSPNSHCNPDVSWWQMGTRTAWSPHPDIDIGVDVMYTNLNTANKGATVNVGGASGAVPPGLYTFANEGIWSAVFRVQRNFIP
jgi:hypothetical protein